MENIKMEQNGKKLILTIDTSKIIGKSEKGSEKVAVCQWETIPGTNIKLLVQAIIAKPKKDKTAKEEPAAKPDKVNKNDKTKTKTVALAEPEEETREERRARRARRKAREAKLAAKAEAAAAKNTKPVRNKPKKDTNKNRRPTRPTDVEPDFSDTDY